MISGMGGPATRSPAAIARILPAFLLVLHWASLSLMQSGSLRGIFEGDAGLSSGVRAAQPVALLCALPRGAIGIEASGARVKRDVAGIEGKRPAALFEGVPRAQQRSAATIDLHIAALPSLVLARAFNARGPPEGRA
jgi:hypothetical protein